MAIREGKWRCTYCSAVNRGRDLDCGGCGVRRGADVEFFLDDDAPAVTDGEQLAAAHAGPDWLCETCGGSNRFHVEACQTCGAPPGNSRYRKVVEGALGAFRDPQGAEAGEPGTTAGTTRAAHAAGDYSNDGGGGPHRGGGGWAKPRWTPSLGVISLAAGLLLLLTLMAATRTAGPSAWVVPNDKPSTNTPNPYATRNVELLVERVGWVRSIEVEEFKQVTDEDWSDEVPAGARVLSQSQAIHHHDRVKVGSHTVPEYYTERVKTGTRIETEHYTDREYDTERYQCGTRSKGNGYFEDVYCTRPVSRTVTKSRNKTVDDYQTVTRTRDRVVEDFEDVPVYRTKVSYAVKRWVAVDKAVAEGSDLAALWPKVAVRAARREGQRSEMYMVYLRDTQSSKPYERAVTAEEFVLFTTGARCVGLINGFDQLVTLAPPASNGSR